MDIEAYEKTFWKNRNQWLYELARDKNLGANAVRVGLIFGTFFSPTREILRPGYGWLMKTASIGSKLTMSKALQQLTAAGYLNQDKEFHMNTTFSLPFDGTEEWSLTKVQKVDS